MDTERRQRINRLKRIIVITLVVAVLIPYVFCLIMMFQLMGLNDRMNRLEELLEGRRNAPAPVETASVEEEQYLASLWENEVPGGVIVAEAAEEEGSFDAGDDPAAGEEAIAEDTPEDEPAELPEEIDPREKTAKFRVYLTFDDGPSPNTGKILDVLKEYGVKATFFVVGKEDEQYTALYKRIVDEGHTLGMHSFSHKYSEIYDSVDAFMADFQKEQAFLQELTGITPRFYRFPGGSSNHLVREKGTLRQMIDYLDGQGVTYFDWNIASGDASGEPLSVEQLVTNVTSYIREGTNVVLMHDAAEKDSTVKALPQVIEILQGKKNLALLPISSETEPVQH